MKATKRMMVLFIALVMVMMFNRPSPTRLVDYAKKIYFNISERRMIKKVTLSNMK